MYKVTRKLFSPTFFWVRLLASIVFHPCIWGNTIYIYIIHIQKKTYKQVLWVFIHAFGVIQNIHNIHIKKNHKSKFYEETLNIKSFKHQKCQCVPFTWLRNKRFYTNIFIKNKICLHKYFDFFIFEAIQKICKNQFMFSFIRFFMQISLAYLYFLINLFIQKIKNMH